MSRLIRKSRSRASREVTDLASSLLATELMAPSEILWVISPWISDVPVIDNSTGDFEFFNDRGWRKIRLAECLATLASSGTSIVVGISDDPVNHHFIRNLKRECDSCGGSEGLTVYESNVADEHEKLIVGDGFALSGSMNFTFRGLFVRGETVQFQTELELVARMRSELLDQYPPRQPNERDSS